MPPVALSVILKTSTAVLPRVWMLAATTDTFATLRAWQIGTANRHVERVSARSTHGKSKQCVWRPYRSVCTRSVSSPGRSGTSTRSMVNFSLASLVNVCVAFRVARWQREHVPQALARHRLSA